MSISEDRQYVTYVEVQRIETPIDGPPFYELRRDRGWIWLQRALFAVLGSIGAFHVHIATTFVRTQKENDDLLARLIGQAGYWIDALHFDKSDLRIYIGPDEYPDLMKLAEFRFMHPTKIMGRIETKSPRRYYGEWHDIPITVVPWMSGALIVEDVR